MLVLLLKLSFVLVAFKPEGNTVAVLRPLLAEFISSFWYVIVVEGAVTLLLLFVVPL